MATYQMNDLRITTHDDIQHMIVNLQLYRIRLWLKELDRKHSGRQGAIWHEIAETFELFDKSGEEDNE